MALLNFSRIEPASYVDGPGKRTTLFVRGCPIRCLGCQNAHLWQSDRGFFFAPWRVATDLVRIAQIAQEYPETLLLTISGGEPFAQADALAELLAIIKLSEQDTHIVAYSGYTCERLREMALTDFNVAVALRLIDVLVDGPYIARLDHPGMQYRGSSNQRVIDMPATLAKDEIVLLDWDTPELIITPTGGILGAEAVVERLADLGAIAETRRCGEVTHG